MTTLSPHKTKWVVFVRLAGDKQFSKTFRLPGVFEMDADSMIIDEEHPFVQIENRVNKLLSNKGGFSFFAYGAHLFE